MITANSLSEMAADAGLLPCSLALRAFETLSGPRIEVDAERYFYPASMLKTPLAAAVYACVEDGVLTLDRGFDVTQANMTLNDKPSPLVPGYVSPLHELIELMITRSDNVATNMLYDILGRENATRIVQQRFGLRSTAFYRKLSGSLPLIEDPQWDRVHRNVHSVEDAARLFELIAADGIPFAATMRETLLRQEWNEKLSLGLRPGDRFAHKTGDTDEVTHDGGILTTAEGDAYVLVVYTGMESNEINNAKFAPFMRSLRAYL